MRAALDNIRASASVKDEFEGRNVATYPDGAIIIDQEVLDEVITDCEDADIKVELESLKKVFNDYQLDFLMLT